MMLIGFSIAILGTEQSINRLTKFNAVSCSCSLSLNHLAPDTAKWVHGGWAINKSQSA
jgi:hypothetical protein